ncbi:cysteine hydrolase family protein [Clostridium pasteurianum]|uniref:cysteine hydrolase family protein n=1 Tax=Clostridium pasteurianum TaxID=1501 RepID=UPI0008DBB2EC|nr:isochorismatase family protein [Clostridium pasteurianum]AOZ78250.1 amidase [Clostridium pasteurianum]
MDINKIFSMEKEIKGKIVYLKDFPKENTAIITVDMVKGFVKKGMLSSHRIISIIDAIVDLNKRSGGYKKIFFLDEHEENSAELTTYAKHCIKGTEESELIDELNTEEVIGKEVAMISKNSTNGFHAPDFKKWLEKNEDIIENYIVVGCEADICVSHLVTTLKTYFNEKNLSRRIVVPINGVETFDFETHDGDLMKVISLWEMKANGIEIVDEIL